MPYNHPGIPKMNKKLCAEGTAIMVGLKEPKKKRKPRKSGYTCIRQEDADRPIITERLRSDGWRITYVEPHGRYSKKDGFNLGDAWIEHDKLGISGWGEYKSAIGKLKPGQKRFRDRCRKNNIKYFVIRLDGDGYTMTDE